VDFERETMGPLPYAALGSGPPLVVLAGLTPSTGVSSDTLMRGAVGAFAALADWRRIVAYNRRPGLARGVSMADFAAEQADAIRSGLGDSPVDVIGTSTGGSIAQQLAADHPEVVNRLVLVSSACRLGEQGRRLQRQVAARIRGGARRKAFAVMAAGLIPPRRGQTPAGVAGWLLGPHLLPDPRDLDDMATTIEAEDDFDLAACRTPIRAATLILAGHDDRFYSPELFEETHRLIAGSDLRLFDGRGHITVMRDRGVGAALGEFLAR
jgi:pimeloyl-ACP methyl ester carboxylesterase